MVVCCSVPGFFSSLDRGFFLPTFRSAIVIISLIIYSHATRLSSRWYFPRSVTCYEGYAVSIHGTLTRWLVDLFGKIYKRKMMENVEKKARDCLIKILYSFYHLRDCRVSGESKVLEIDKFRCRTGFKKQLYGGRQW